MVAHNQGVPTVTIANGSGLTVAQMRMTYGPHMTPEEHDALFFTSEAPAPEPEPEPEPETPATDELDIPPEPLEYPVAPYEPPANDKPDDKEAA
jgi:hypothetical protein